MLPSRAQRFYNKNEINRPAIPDSRHHMLHDERTSGNFRFKTEAQAVCLSHFELRPSSFRKRDSRDIPENFLITSRPKFHSARKERSDLFLESGTSTNNRVRVVYDEKRGYRPISGMVLYTCLSKTENIPRVTRRATTCRTSCACERGVFNSRKKSAFFGTCFPPGSSGLENTRQSLNCAFERSILRVMRKGSSNCILQCSLHAQTDDFLICLARRHNRKCAAKTNAGFASIHGVAKPQVPQPQS